MEFKTGNLFKKESKAFLNLVLKWLNSLVFSCQFYVHISVWYTHGVYISIHNRVCVCVCVRKIVVDFLGNLCYFLPLFIKTPLIFSHYFCFVCMGVCLHVSVHHLHVVPMETRRRGHIPWSWSCRDSCELPNGCWELNSERSSARVVILDHWAISPSLF